MVDETINPVTQCIILKIIRFHVYTENKLLGTVSLKHCDNPHCSKNSQGCFIYILDSSNSRQSHFELVSLVLALEATERVTQMAVELKNIHLISVQRKRLM